MDNINDFIFGQGFLGLCILLTVTLSQRLPKHHGRNRRPPEQSHQQRDMKLSSPPLAINPTNSVLVHA